MLLNFNEISPEFYLNFIELRSFCAKSENVSAVNKGLRRETFFENLHAPDMRSLNFFQLATALSRLPLFGTSPA